MLFHVQKRKATSILHKLTGKELFSIKSEKNFVRFFNVYLFE